MHKPFMVSKKASALALVAPEPTVADKPPRPVNMDRLAHLSKPLKKKEDPTVRNAPTKTKKL